MQIKNFSIFKVTDKKNETQPDYRISAKVGENFVEIGAGWIKESNGGKYISCKLSDKYVDHTKGTKRDGFHIATDELKEIASSYKPDPDDTITLEDLPF